MSNRKHGVLIDAVDDGPEHETLIVQTGRTPDKVPFVDLNGDCPWCAVKKLHRHFLTTDWDPNPVVLPLEDS